MVWELSDCKLPSCSAEDANIEIVLERSKRGSPFDGSGQNTDRYAFFHVGSSSLGKLPYNINDA